MIPKQLRKNEFRFIKTNGKIPIEQNWQTFNNYSHEDIKNWKGNYGVATGFGNLIVLDFDDDWAIENIMPKLPEGFSVQTGSGKFHKYFICKNGKSLKIFKDRKTKETLVDIQYKGKQVIAPNSTHPTTLKKYVVHDDLPIPEIDMSEIMALFHDFLKTDENDNIKKYDNDDVVDEIKHKLSLKDVLSRYGLDTNKNPTKCKWHGSKGGKCFSFNDDLFYCFHCDVGGDIFTFVMEEEKCNFVDAKNILCKMAGIEITEINRNNPNLTTRNVMWDFNITIPNIEDNARQILEHNPLYFDDNKIWWKWNPVDKIWVKIKDWHIIEFVKKTFQAQGLSKSHTRTTILNALKDESQSRKPKEKKKTWLQIGNKIYDISNDDVIEPSKRYFVKTKIPIRLGTSEKTPKIDALFTEWLGDEKDILYDIMAFCMSPTYFLEIVFWLIGSGANGKGKFLDMLTTFLGEENVTSQNLEILNDSKQRFQTTCLRDKLLCTLGDGNYGFFKDTKVIKELAGETDYIRAEIKGGGFVSFKNTAKLIGSFNTLPESLDKTKGWYRRQHITEFKNEFDCQKPILVESFKDEFSNLALKLLNRLKIIYNERTLKGWDILENRREKYDRLSNPIKQFFDNKMVVNYNGYFTQTKIYDEYKKFALENGYNQFGFREFRDRLKAFPEIEYIKKDVYVTNTGFIFGREKDIPEDLKIKDDYGNYFFIEKTKLKVFSGYSFRGKDTKKTGKNIRNQQVDTGVFHNSVDTKTYEKRVENDEKMSKIDQIDPFQHFLESLLVRKRINSKSGSIWSISSIEDKKKLILKLNEILRVKNQISTDYLMKMGFPEPLIENLKKKGILYEPQSGFIAMTDPQPKINEEEIKDE